MGTASTPAVLREIQQLSELVTVRYSIQKVVALEEQKQPLGSEKLLLIVQARVLAGVNLAAIQPRDISISASGETVVRMPPAEILNVIVDEKETRVWDRQVTWWTPWVPFNPDLERRARLAAIESVKASAVEMGIVNDARQNAERALRALLAGFGVRGLRFVWGS